MKCPKERAGRASNEGFCLQAIRARDRFLQKANGLQAKGGSAVSVIGFQPIPPGQVSEEKTALLSRLDES
jgi:hypothetical protein